MAYPPTAITCNTAAGTFSLTIPANTGDASALSDFIEAIHDAGGFWTTQNVATAQPASQQWVPWEQIYQITAS